MAIADLLVEVGIEGSVTTLSAPGKSIGVFNINVGSTANWPAAGKTVYFAMRTINPSTVTTANPSGQVAGSYSSWKGIVGTNAITSMQLQSGSTDQVYAAGSNTQVFIPVSAARENALVAWGQVHADNLGNLKTAAVQSALGLTSLNGYTPLGATFASVVYNGNRSYTGVINGADYTNVLSPGMRLQTTRTVPAPTQSTSLNGTTQYWSKTAPAGMTFTDNFTCSAWIKLTSYQAGTMISRYNGTSGWALAVTGDGRVSLTGVNAGSTRGAATYQSVPLNKWVHVAATLTMSTSVANVYIDGVLVPSVVTGAATSLVQAGNLEVGSQNAGTQLFSGKLAQVALFSAVLSQATIQLYISQGLLGTETSNVSVFSFSGTANDLNSTNANNLTANGAVTATSADSPFGTQASGLISSTLDYAIVQSVTFSTNTTVLFQVPEACSVPTIGGVAAVVYSSNKIPYGFPSQRTKWQILSVLYADTTTTYAAAATYYNHGFRQLIVPTGEWILTDQIVVGNTGSVAAPMAIRTAVGTSTTNIIPDLTTRESTSVSVTNLDIFSSRSTPLSLGSATTYLGYVQFETGGGTGNSRYYGVAIAGQNTLTAENAYL